MTRAPGLVERLLRSRRASTSRCISYSDGCLGRAAIDDKKKTSRTGLGLRATKSHGSGTAAAKSPLTTPLSRICERITVVL